MTIIKTHSKDVRVKLTQTKTKFGYPSKIENRCKTHPRLLRYEYRYYTTSHQLSNLTFDRNEYFSKYSPIVYNRPDSVTLPYAVLVISCCPKMIFEELILLAK